MGASPINGLAGDGAWREWLVPELWMRHWAYIRYVRPSLVDVIVLASVASIQLLLLLLLLKCALRACSAVEKTCCMQLKNRWTPVVKCQTASKRRTDGQTRTATTSTAIAAVMPCRRRCDSPTVSRHKRTDERTNGRTDGRTGRETDAGNRIWCICNIWWQ